MRLQQESQAPGGQLFSETEEADFTILGKVPLT
jgi:hypothetical protein